MEQEKTITVTRALVELKRYEARINQAITTATLGGLQVGINQSARVLHSQNTIDGVKKDTAASIQKVDQLIKNRADLKAAILRSNANTIVELGGAKMTVAEAIDLKQTLPYKEKMLSQMKSQLATWNQRAEQANVKLQADISAHIQALMGADKAKQDEQTIRMIEDAQRSQKELSVIGQDILEREITKLEENILMIQTELDFVLSESNALTSITVKV